VQESPYNVGLDAAILMNPQTWVASGHVGGFSDPLMDCRECHERFRADKIIEDFTPRRMPKPIDGLTFRGDGRLHRLPHDVPCPVLRQA
jgi:glycyl-tRNA synthetase